MSEPPIATGGNFELREFLRSRRARITPEEVGLFLQPGTRRVPGLRREEVAQLAGESVDYYVRLERGRGSNVSESVLDAIARALRLNETERHHRFTVARPTWTRHRPMPPQQVRPGLQRVLDTLTEIPALVLGRRLAVLAADPLARSLYTDFDGLPPRERNMARFIFLDEAAHERYTEWESAAGGIVATLQPIRWIALPRPSARRADRRTFRTRQGLPPPVGRPRRVSTQLRHQALPPPRGRRPHLVLRTLAPIGDPDQTLDLHTADPGSPSEEALRLLASWTSEPNQFYTEAATLRKFPPSTSST